MEVRKLRGTGRGGAEVAEEIAEMKGSGVAKPV
jgi:hypothetical protein